MKHILLYSILLHTLLLMCLSTSFSQSGWILQEGDTLNAISLIDANTGTAVGVSGVILRTTDGGATWTRQSRGTTAALRGVSFTDGSTGTTVGEYTILRTTDGGTSWMSQTSEIMGELYGVSFTDANTGTAVGMYGTILRTTTGGVTDVEDSPTSSALMPDKPALEQNYPNPFNPTTTISYRLPGQSHVTLKVFDVLGREVATLVNGEQTAGYKSVTWNAANIPSGIYFYRITASPIPTSRDGQAGAFTETKKLLLLG